MAASVCPHCQNGTFELQEGPITGIHHKLLFVQCARCGAPIGAVEARNPMLDKDQDARLHAIENQLSSLSHAVGRIGHIVGELAHQHTV
jgi:hypothetical protein